MLELVGETAALALGLLEKNGVLIPFCKARSTDQGNLIIQAGDHSDLSEDASGQVAFPLEDSKDTSEYDPEKYINSARFELKRRIAAGTILEFAFCSDNFIKIQNQPEERRFLKIEFQNGMPESGIYLFPLTVEDGNAAVGSYFIRDLAEKLL